MQAVIVTRFGGPEVLELREVPPPVPRPGEVLVRVRAAGVNPLDWKLRNGELRLVSAKRPPYIPGSDLAGLVAAVGDGVAAFRPGDRVFGWTVAFRGEPGTYADFAVVPATQLLATPPNVTDQEAAGVCGSGLSAWVVLTRLAPVRAGQRVLVIGAAGGLGTFAVQIARARGAHVTGTSSAANLDLVRGLGAEAVDYRATDTRTLAGPFDVVFDTVNAFHFGDLRHLLARDGTYVDTMPGPRRWLAGQLSRLRGGPRARTLLLEPTLDDLRGLAALMADGRVRTVVGHLFPLREAAEAQRLSEGRHVRGKIVLLPGT